MPVLADRVKETTTTTGTGTYDLAGAATGFAGFVAAIGDGKACYYTVEDGTDWEVGIGTVTDASPDTLSRDTILASSNGDAAVNWGAGTKDVFVTIPAKFATEVSENSFQRLRALTGTVGNVGATETDLLSFILPGGTLKNNGDEILIGGVGQIGAGGGSKTIRIYVGATSLVPVNASGATSVPWGLNARLVRLSATTGLLIPFSDAPVAGLGSGSDVISVGFSATWADDQTIKFTGENSTAVDDNITQELLTIDLVAESTADLTRPGRGERRELILLQQQEAQNTAGGTFTTGSWQTRDLNALVVDAGSNVKSLVSGAFTLKPGTYEFEAWGCSNRVNKHQLRLQNTTDAATVAIGASYGNSGDASAGSTLGGTIAQLGGRFTITQAKTFELQHQCGATRGTDGFGVATNFTTEVFAQVLLWKVEEDGSLGELAPMRDFIHLKDEKAQNTAGGGFTSGAWQTRELNAIAADTASLVNLSSNAFTLPPGVYELEASAPAHAVNRHQVRLQNTDDDVTIAVGSSQHTTSTTTVINRSFVSARFAIDVPTTFELQHRAETTKATDGFGVASNLTTEVYAEVKIWRLTRESIDNVVSIGERRHFGHIQDRKAQNTAGGTATSGSWETRDLTDVLADAGGVVDLTSNQFTLQPGTYEFAISVPGYAVMEHQARLQNITDGVTALTGTSEYTEGTVGVDDGSQTCSTIFGKVTIASAKTFEVQHRVAQTAGSSVGHGRAGNFTTEVYTDVKFWRIEKLANYGQRASPRDEFVHVQDQKTAGTAGGTFTSGAWQTRDLNALLSDTGGNASIASNQITLEPGTYELLAMAATSAVDVHKMRWRDITNGVTVLVGLNVQSFSGSGAGGTSGCAGHVAGRFTITAQTTFELQHRCGSTFSSSGFGRLANYGEVEVFADVKLWKIAAPLPGFGEVTETVRVQHQTSSGSGGGALTTGSWAKRTLNTIVENTAGDLLDLTSSVLTLAPGTYDARAYCSFFNGNGKRIKLRDTDRGVDLVVGVNSRGNTAADTGEHAYLHGRFTIHVATAVELQYYNLTSTGSPSEGAAITTGDNEVLADLLLKRVIRDQSQDLRRFPYALLRDEKAQNTAGGTFTSGAWRTRDLNVESVDTDGIVSLSSNQFTLPAGSYRIRALVPGYAVDSHQARLQNITDATTELVGSSESAGTGSGLAQTLSVIAGEFTIQSAKTFEIQHQAETTGTTSGFGAPANFTTEVYTTVELWQTDASRVGGVVGANPATFDARLTLSSTLPVAGDLSAQATAYLLPFRGNRISLFDNTTWVEHAIPSGGLSLAASGLTADAMHDAFVYVSGGVLALEAVEWTSDSARATDLVMQDGVYVKTGELHKRYVGSFRTISSSGTKFEDSVRQRLLWNYYNQVEFADVYQEATNSWSIASGSWAATDPAANGGWKHEFVVGVDERPMRADGLLYGYNGAAAAIDLDWTTGSPASSGSLWNRTQSNASGETDSINPTWNDLPGIGYHFLQMIERDDGGAAAVAYGDLGGDQFQSGMVVRGWR